MTMLVDSGALRHYFDDELRFGLKDKLLIYKELERPHKIVTVGHVLLGTATRTASGTMSIRAAVITWILQDALHLR